MPYFDHNATTPLLPAAREAWLRATDEAWQNPSSPYRVSARAHRLLEAARVRLADLIGAQPAEIVFTGGATEANNAVIAWASRDGTGRAPGLFSATEHPSVLAPMAVSFAGRGEELPVDREGVLDLAAFAAALTRFPGGLVAVMAANNETGVLQPVAEISERCRATATAYLCDASQWIGRLPPDGMPPTAFLVACAHKFGGPKGVGFVRVPFAARDFHGQRGGEQESNRRAGTENYPAIAAMVAALEFAAAQSVGERERWRQAFGADVSRRVPGTRLIGSGVARLWNTVSLCLPDFENTRWVTRLDKLGFEVSTGSACASGSSAPSHVLAAMGLSPAEARRTIRLSSGWETTEDDWRMLADAIANVWQQLRSESAGGLI